MYTFVFLLCLLLCVINNNNCCGTITIFYWFNEWPKWPCSGNSPPGTQVRLWLFDQRLSTHRNVHCLLSVLQPTTAVSSWRRIHVVSALICGSAHPTSITNVIHTSSVASLGGAGGGADHPWWHHPRGDTGIKLFFVWLNLARTLDKRRGKMEVVRRRQLKKVITFQWATTKKGRQFFKKVTPSVTAPGDTNPSDATAT